MEKFLADENIPYESVQALRTDGVDIKAVFEIQPGLSDENILEFAFENELIVVTFDKDFGDWSSIAVCSLEAFSCFAFPQGQFRILER